MKYLKEHAANFSRGILVLLLFCLMFGCYYNIRRANEEEKWLKHPEEVMLHIARMRLTLIETEVLTTNYILTGDRFYLRKFQLEKTKVLHELTAIKGLINTNTASVGFLNAGSKEITSVIQFSEGMMGLRKNAGLDQTILLARKKLGNKSRERAEAFLLRLEVNESKLLISRTLVFKKAAFEMNLSIFFTCIFFLFLLIMLVKRARKITIECSQLVKELSRSATDLEQLNHKLLIQNGALEQFAHMVSHDLRAPVANIIGLGNILEMLDEDSEDKNAVLTHIVSSVNKFDHILRNLNHVLQLENQVAEKECNGHDVLRL